MRTLCWLRHLTGAGGKGAGARPGDTVLLQGAMVDSWGRLRPAVFCSLRSSGEGVEPGWPERPIPHLRWRERLRCSQPQPQRMGRSCAGSLYGTLSGDSWVRRESGQPLLDLGGGWRGSSSAAGSRVAVVRESLATESGATEPTAVTKLTTPSAGTVLLPNELAAAANGACFYTRSSGKAVKGPSASVSPAVY
jgi:hypothetical protein